MTRPLLRVLMYHRVMARAEANGRDPALISATPDVFERQMRYLARHYAPISADQLLRSLRDQERLPDRAVLVTFDDGCRDFDTTAWPIMQRYGVPATVFVSTAYPDEPSRQFWWDRLYRALAGTTVRSVDDLPCGPIRLDDAQSRARALRTLQRHVKTQPHEVAMQLVDTVCARLGEPGHAPADVLGWADLRRLASEGVAIGAHTRTHPALTRLDHHQIRDEVAGSRDDLQRELGTAVPVFAYPFGDHDGRVVEIVRDEGFEAAVTCQSGFNTVPVSDPLQMRRTNVSSRTSAVVFAARLTAMGASLDTWRNRHKGLNNAHPRRQGAAYRSAAAAVPQLRIAYVMSRFPKLSETFVLNEMMAMEALGVQVELCPLLRERQPTSHPEVEAWLRRAHFEAFLSARVLEAHAHYLRHRPRAYVGALLEILRGTLGSANFFIGALGTFPKAVRFAYDLDAAAVAHVHAHFATHPTVAALVIHRLTGIPFSFTAHGSDLHVDRRMLAVKVSAAAFAVTVSEFNKDVMVRECGPASAERIHVIHCGVDPSFFAGPRDAPAREVFSFACVASFEPVKGHAYLLDACRALLAQGVSFHCHLVGDGPLRGDVERRIRQEGLARNVTVHGGLPRAEVAGLLNRMHAAVLASHPTPDGKREGIPVALMEAMAAGLPVVATAISGIPELVEHERSGLLVPSGDGLALAQALARLAGDEALCVRLGDVARTRVRARFDLRTNTATLLDAIRNVAAGAAAATVSSDPERASQAISVDGPVPPVGPDPLPAEVPGQASPASSATDVRRRSDADAKQHIRGSGLLLGGRFIAVLLNFAVQVLTVRYLAKNDYGAFAYALGVASMSSSLILLGLGKAIPRIVPIEIEKTNYARAFGNIVLAAATVLGLGALLVLVLYAFSDTVGGVVRASTLSLSLLLILIVMAPLDAFDHLLQQLVAVFGTPRAILFRRQVLGPALKLAAILIVIATAGDAYGLAFGYVAGGFIGVWLYVVVLWRAWRRAGLLPYLNLRRLAWPVRELFGQSIPLLSSDLLVIWRTSLAVLMLEFFHPTTAVAEYRAVLPLAGLNMVVFEAFSVLFVPHASRMYARGDVAGVGELYWKTSIWIAVLTFPIFAVTTALAQPVTISLFGPRYADASVVLAILAVGFYMNAATGFNSATLRVFGRVRTIVTADLVAMLVAVGLSLLLVPRYGVIGAALGTTSALWCQNVLNHIFLSTGPAGVRLFDWKYLRLYGLIVLVLTGLALVEYHTRLPLWVSLVAVGLASMLVVRVSRHVIDPLTAFPELRRVPFAERLLS